MSQHREPDAKIEIRISCNKLKNTDKLSKSDPCCVVSLQNGDTWEEIGRTEVLKDNENPEFTKTIEANYFFQRQQNIRFSVYDVDDFKSNAVTDKNLIGSIETTISEVVSNSPFTGTLILKGKETASTITLEVEELSNSQEVLNLTFSAQKLDNKDTVGKSDPFLALSRKDGENWTIVAKTEVIKDNLNPTWGPLRAKISQLCSGNQDDPVKIDCFDYESNGKHELIGSFTTSVRELKEGVGKQWPVINPTKAQKKSSYQNSGIVTLKACEV